MHMPRVRVNGGHHPVAADLAGDPPPPVRPVAALSRLHVLPGDQRQQRHRLRRLLLQISRHECVQDRGRVIDQRRHQRIPRGLVIPGDRRLTRITVIMGVTPLRDDRAGGGDLTADPADRRDQLRHRVLGSHRVIEHHRIQRPHRLATQHPGRSDHRPHRLKDPVRAIGGRQPPPPVRQRRRMEPLMIQRQPARDLPPQVAAHRRDRVPIRQIMKRLQHQHRRRDLTRQARPARHAREQVREQLRREHLTTVPGQKGENAAVGDQMPHQRRRVQ